MQVLIRYEANLDIGPSIGLDGYKHGVPVRNRTSMREQSISVTYLCGLQDIHTQLSHFDILQRLQKAIPARHAGFRYIF
jgi:hypothetical protein